MNERAELLSKVSNMLQQADDQKVRFIYILLCAMLEEKGGAA